MELSTVLSIQERQSIEFDQQTMSSPRAFIQANTVDVSLTQLKQEHIIPVWLKDNEPLISHGDFIDALYEVVCKVYAGEDILEPGLRVSHPIKGRVPTAKDKPAKDLLDHEKTLYYERMMFVVEVPSIAENINGNRLSLTIGGIKAYNQDNLYNKKGSLEHFKVFVGFKNAVCTNLCVATDGMLADLKVRSIHELQQCIYQLLTEYNIIKHVGSLQRLVHYSVNESQFAQFIGKARMYQFLSNQERVGIMPLRFSDTQMISVARDYFQDENFCRGADGSIGMWNLYNLLTGANKTSYIDSFLERASNASDIASKLASSIEQNSYNWFLS